MVDAKEKTNFLISSLPASSEAVGGPKDACQKEKLSLGSKTAPHSYN
jgi:hypothetical protein